MNVVRILHLYPRDMNTYGDWGNVLTLIRRIEWHGYQPEVVTHEPGATLSPEVDIVIGGGGQNSGQDAVASDLLALGPAVRQLAEDGVPMLVVCGLYQLFGDYFQVDPKHVIKGIEVFDARTVASRHRLVGDAVIATPFGEVVGYENHSGLTTLGLDQPAFGNVIAGLGNNGQDGTEGAVSNHVYGTYLHGPLLPRNPAFADHLIRVAVERRYGHFDVSSIDDSLARMAAITARRHRTNGDGRPRSMLGRARRREA